MIFLMISTHKSQNYTLPSLNSLLKNTDLQPHDKVVIIDNDASLPDLEGARIVRNERPRSFAENANFGIGLSQILEDDLLVLNNDIIFTAGWLDYFIVEPNSILIPYCNQNIQYSAKSLQLSFAMDLEEYAGRDEELEEIARAHRQQIADGPDVDTSPVMSFFCVYIPWKVARMVGNFDESFGRGGGEDVDYRLRALKAGVNVFYSRRCYLLHFGGKSTWRSGEPADETRSADVIYQRRFVEKWGEPAAHLFLQGPNKRDLAERYGVLAELERQDYRAILDRLESMIARP